MRSLQDLITVTLQSAPTTIFVRGVHAQRGGIWFEGELMTQQGTFINGKQMELYIDGVFKTGTLTDRKFTSPVTYLDGHWEFSLGLPLGIYELQVKFPGDSSYGPSQTSVYTVEVTETGPWITWEILALAGILVVAGVVALQLISPARMVVAMPTQALAPVAVK